MLTRLVSPTLFLCIFNGVKFIILYDKLFIYIYYIIIIYIYLLCNIINYIIYNLINKKNKQTTRNPATKNF